MTILLPEDNVVPVVERIEVIVDIVDTEEEQDIIALDIVARPWERQLENISCQEDYELVNHCDSQLEWLKEDIGNLLGYFDNYKKGTLVEPVGITGEYTLVIQLEPRFIPPIRGYFGETNDDGGEIEYKPIQYYVLNDNKEVLMGGIYR